MTKELAEKELEEIYIGIGGNELKVEDFIDRIQELESIVNPTPAHFIHTPPSIYCECDKWGCWECAARRGGCMEDV